MRRKPRIAAAVIPALLLLLLLTAGCDGSPGRPSVAPSSATPSATAAALPPIPDGTYRVTITAADIRAAGLPDTEIHENIGVFTLTFRDGDWAFHQAPPDPVNYPDFTGTYTGDASTVVFVTDSPSTFAGEEDTLGWRLDGEDLRFTVIGSTKSVHDLYIIPALKAIYASHPWRRVR